MPATGGPPHEPTPGAEEVTFVLEVDRARVRELGWSREGASDAQVVEAAAGMVNRRCRALGRAARLHLESESGRIEVVLPALDSRERELFEGMLRDLGLCEFFFVAEEASLVGLDIDLAVEQQKLELWHGANPELPLAAFDALGPDQQGPHPRLAWLRSRFGDTLGPEVPILLPARLDDHLGASTFARVNPAQDEFGYPSLWCEVLSSRWSDLTRITGEHVGQRMAVVIGDQLRSAPTLDWKWIGGGSIEGHFSDEELMRLAESFRKLEGPLRIAEIR